MSTREKKKGLLMSDDLRMFSGVGVMSKQIVLNTVDKYDWVQLASAVNHSQKGKRVNVSEDIQRQTGVDDADVRIYPYDSYGDQEIVRYLLQEEDPDFILHFTDPRQWIWLYMMEHEIRTDIPLLYYHVWDDLPYPMYNASYYEACDMIMNISKQTQNIVRNVQPKLDDWQTPFVPHGINTEEFYPIIEEEAKDKEIDVSDDDNIEADSVTEWELYQKFEEEFYNGNEYDFVLLYNNRNIRRKMVGDVLMAYKRFCQSLSDEEAEKCALVLHTTPVDPNGTNLPAVINELCSEYNVVLSGNKMDVRYLNYMYNTADATINIASNEGFGLSSAESIMTGTPIINNVTGGLQDQMRFEDEDGNWLDFSDDLPSNHRGEYTECGEWAFPVFPSTISLVGSVPTPYIYDDRVAVEDVVEQIKNVYNLPKEELEERGMKGREWALSDEANMSAEAMADGISKGIETTLENWEERDRFEFIKV